MKRGLLMVLSLAAVLLAGTMAWSDRAVAQDGDMLLLDGQTWLQLSPDSKLAFVWGMAHVVEFERQLAEEHWDPGAKTLVPHLVTGFKGKTLHHVVVHVDNYYAVSTDRLGDPVIKAVVHAVVLPKL